MALVLGEHVHERRTTGGKLDLEQHVGPAPAQRFVHEAAIERHGRRVRQEPDDPVGQVVAEECRGASRIGDQCPEQPVVRGGRNGAGSALSRACLTWLCPAGWSGFFLFVEFVFGNGIGDTGGTLQGPAGPACLSPPVPITARPARSRFEDAQSPCLPGGPR